ncbi:MAG: DUF3995 domain-containing protein [Chloroflexota bacterium]
MKTIAGKTVAAIFALLSLIHIYWAMGGTRGTDAVVPTQKDKPLFTPPKAATLIVATGLFAAMLTVLGRLGMWGRTVPRALFQWGTRILAILFLFRSIGDFKWVGFFKTIKNSRFAWWDSRLFSPLTLLIAGLCTLLELDQPVVRQRLSRWFPSISAENQSALWLRLGDDQAKSVGVGNKGALLDQAAIALLPVPSGIILLEEACRNALHVGLVVETDDTLKVIDSAQLLNYLDLPSFDRPLAVRSAFSAEDGDAESLAGFFTSKLFVDPTQPEALATAITEVWASALKRPGHFRRDVLIMEMVNARHAGVAFTEQAYEDDLINYTSGTADALVSGEVAGQSLMLPKLRFWEKQVDLRFTIYDLRLKLNRNLPQSPISNLQSPFNLRLQRLLRDIRVHFGAKEWDIEWADDGQECWLVQIRPITRPSRRNEAFTSANLKEILPDLPSRYMTSLIAACAEGLFAYYRGFDPTLPKHRPIIEVFQGRPVFNISLLTEMMRCWGLPTRLVTGNVGGEADIEVGFQVGRFFRNTFVLLGVGQAQLQAVTSSKRTINRILARTEQRPTTFQGCVDLHRWLFTTLVTEMFSLTSAMSGPLLILRQAGVLAEHNARQRTISTEMFTDLEPLRTLALADPAIQSALEQGQVPADAQFQTMWHAYINKHGHRGVYESDIARPRLHEVPEPLLMSLAQPTGQRQPPPPHTSLGRLTQPVWWQASRTMQARESFRYHVIIGFDRLRQAFLALADPLVAEGVLPNREAIWDLDLDELSRLDTGWQPDSAFFEARQREIEQLQSYDLPDLFHRFDDLEQYRLGATDFSAEQRLKGISLTGGQVEGHAWVLTEPSTALPPDFTAETTILIARSVDAGWIPTFGRVAGVVAEIGGDLSHGSIILREIGLPAITNVRGVTRAIQTGDPVILYADSGVVERVTE